VIGARVIYPPRYAAGAYDAERGADYAMDFGEPPIVD
jgi:hypothetical protein